MILNIEGDVNRYYMQTLCMVFFPGATFGTAEQPTPDTPVVSVRVTPGEAGSVSAWASIRWQDRVTEGVGEAHPTDGIPTDRLTKLAASRALFSAGKQYFGYTPPWGILTGVRPAKVATEILERGIGVRAARAVLQNEYLCQPRKAALAVAVASTERRLTRRLPENSCSVYISIPFCPSRCAYCSFVSAISGRLLSMIDDYLAALGDEMDRLFDLIRRRGLRVMTVYIGGGTPTVLNEKQLAALLRRLAKNIDPSTLTELTLEAGRPDTINAEKLRIAREAGVTRISVNPQTLSNEVLQRIGRRHTVADFYRAYEIAARSGIPYINVDLIAGLPGDTFPTFSETMDTIIGMAPQNITVHTFAVKTSADILREGRGVYSMTGGDAAKSVDYSQIRTRLAGYRPYYMYRQKNTVGNLENVGFSQKGAEGRYNIYMMEELHSIFAAGAGAVTKLVRPQGSGTNVRIERIFAPKYPYEYLREAASPDRAALLESRVSAFFDGKDAAGR